VSFYANKVITTGEGGMVLTNQEGLHAQLARARNLGFNETRRFVHEDAAWVYRMPALSAALGYSQVARFKELLSDQIERGNHYQELLHSVRGIQLPATEWGGVQNIYWVFGFVLHPELGVDARSFMKRLLEVGIGSRPFFYPLHRQPVLEKFGWANQPTLDTSEALGDFGLYVPSLGTTREDRQRVAAVISELIEG
jgi:perosamine synthetase